MHSDENECCLCSKSKTFKKMLRKRISIVVETPLIQYKKYRRLKCDPIIMYTLGIIVQIEKAYIFLPQQVGRTPEEKDIIRAQKERKCCKMLCLDNE